MSWFKDALRYPFRNRRRIFYYYLNIVPVFGNLLFLGYIVEAFRGQVKDPRTVLIKLSDPKEMLKTGLKASILFSFYALLLSAAWLIPYIRWAVWLLFISLFPLFFAKFAASGAVAEGFAINRIISILMRNFRSYLKMQFTIFSLFIVYAFASLLLITLPITLPGFVFSSLYVLARFWSDAETMTLPKHLVKELKRDDLTLNGRKKKDSANFHLPFKERLLAIIFNRMKIPHLHFYLDKAGLDLQEKKLSKLIFRIAIAANLVLSVILIYKFYIKERETLSTILILVFSWTLLFVFVSLFIWLVFYIYVDMRVRLRNRPKKESIAESKKVAVKKKKFQSTSSRIRSFSLYIERAGLDISIKRVFVIIFRLVILMSLLVNAYLLLRFSEYKPGVLYTIVISIALWSLGFLALLFLCWTLFFSYLDLRIYKRKKQVEEVLPDFLQLTSANISAGMTIDRALWHAVRPRFGVLAKEIEEVAKSTIAGERLENALFRFADRYDSEVLKRSINLLLEGVQAGGKMGEILNRIAINIQENRIIKKEMSANVTTYAIFIGFATVIAAPFLFGLSTELIVIMSTLISGLNLEPGTMSGGFGGMLAFSTDSINLGDFKIFAMASITVTSFFSAVIISIIRKGNVKDGIQLIPLFIATSLALYIVAFKLLHAMLGGFF